MDVSVAGVRSVVHDTQPGPSSDAVVFVHGNPGPMDDFESIIPAVSELGRVVAMDLPGFGRADHPRDFDFSVPGYARHLGGVLDQVGVRRAHLVLHDFGGPFGLSWAAQYPQRVASISLIGTGIMEGFRWHKYAKIWQTPVLGELFQLLGTAGVLKRALDQDNPIPIPREHVDRVMGYADWAHKRAVLKLYRSARDVSAQLTSLKAALQKLTVPVCVIWPEGDPYLPVAFASRQRETFAQAEVHTLKGLGHWPTVDDPNAVLGPLLPFLKWQLVAPASATREGDNV
ncbi:MAG TPA: alpha/beta hydrolase [Polyangiales bacterium]|nr:alpha/beta hydrolase [Polyangiales bacterium]